MYVYIDIYIIIIINMYVYIYIYVYTWEERGNHRVGVTLFLDLDAGGRWIKSYFFFRIFRVSISQSLISPQTKIWFVQTQVRAATPILHLVDALFFSILDQSKKKRRWIWLLVGSRCGSLLLAFFL